MKNIKHIFTDLDGTLFKDEYENDKKIDLEHANFINELNNHGIGFSVATGRDYLNAKKVLELNNVNNYEYIIGCNGAQIYSKAFNQLIYVRTFTENETNYMIKAFEYMDNKYPDTFYLHSYSIGKEFTHANIYSKEKQSDVITNEINKLYKIASTKGIGLLPRITYSYLLLRNSYKFMMCYANENLTQEQIIEFGKDLETNFPNLTYAPTSSSIEITPKDISKNSAIIDVCNRYLKLKQDEVAVFGDGGNDLLMLEYHKHSFTRFDTLDFVKNVSKNVVNSTCSLFVIDTLKDIIKLKANN